MRHRLPPALLAATLAAGCADVASPAAEPRPAPVAAAVIGGNEYACALLAIGTVYCSGALTVVSGGPRGLTSITGGEQHACGIHETGAVRCFGVSTHGRLNSPGGTDFSAVAPGTYHACALRGGGEIVCWGNDDDGQATPPRGSGFRAIAASRGGNRSCAIDADGAIVCWGSAAASPPSGTGWLDLILTENGGCAQDASGDLTCWGLPTVDRIDGTGVRAVSAGRDFICLIRNGRIECAGETDAPIESPPDGTDFVQIGAGYRHVCALRARGTVACWGSMTAFPGIAQD